MSNNRHPGFVVVGNPGSRRLDLFQAALARLEQPPARIVPYAGLLSSDVILPDVVPTGAVVRIESPGKDFEVERQILAAGAEAAAGSTFAHIPTGSARRLAFDKGLILYPHQWYLGLEAALDLVTRQLDACPAHRLMNAPADIKVMFDKPRCHQRLQRSGVPVPQGLGMVRSFDELVTRMTQTGCRRVFVKLAYGSSASGVVAYRTNGSQHQAITTVEVVSQGGVLRLYNTRRIRICRDVREISVLIDALCHHRVHVEHWLPKAGLDNHAFDLRIVVIDGRARHVVVRQSQSPMTNLHLLNARGDPDAVQARMGVAAWAAARRTCQQAAACFPASLYAGIDLLIAPGYRRHAVLEVNAFGDLLPGVLHDGVDTYTAEILALLGAAHD